jgi:hypothetical protein
MKQDKAYVCPQCASPAIHVPVLAGADFVCEACGWGGPDAVVVPFTNPFNSSEQTWEKFGMELLNVFSQVGALPIGRVLVKWGFVSVEPSGKPSMNELVRYLRAMAGAIVTAVLEERKKIEVERVESHVRKSKYRS